MNSGYHTVPLSFNRQILIASVSVTKEKHAIHSFTEVDITIPRQIIRDHFDKTGEKLSFTAYIVACLARVMRDFPRMNSFIKGRKLIVLEDVTISVLIERELEGERIPEPFGIRKARLKTFKEIHREIREAQQNQDKNLGSLSNFSWIRFIPGFLLRTFIRLADKNIGMAKRYGKVAITAVGMFSKESVWFIPHGSATVLLTAGSINNRLVEIEGKTESREHLCLTVTFDHDIVDGAPAARFMDQLIKTIKDGKCLQGV